MDLTEKARLDWRLSKSPNNHIVVPTKVVVDSEEASFVRGFTFPKLSEFFADAALCDSTQTFEKICSSIPVEPNWIDGAPTTALIEKYLAEAPHQPLVVVAIGGGSTIDFAKAVIGLRMSGQEKFKPKALQFSGLEPSRKAERPILIAMPTTAGSGADQSRYFVAYDSATGAKKYGRSWALCADYAIVNPALLSTIRPSDAAIGAFDAFCHGIEALCNRDEASFWSDSLAEGIIEVVLNSMETKLDRNSAEAWTRLGMAASVAGAVISNCRTGAPHELAGPLTEQLRIPHGVALFFCFSAALRDIPHPWLGKVSRACKLNGSVEKHAIDILQQRWVDFFLSHGVNIGKYANMVVDGLDNLGVGSAMTERILQDDVLCSICHPTLIGPNQVREMILGVRRFAQACL